MSALRRFQIAFAGVALVLGAVIAAAAQPAPKDQPGGAMQGLQLNRDQPVKIESDTLEVRDKRQQATFIGKVKLTQGDTILQCQSLVIFYDNEPAAPAQKKGGAKGAQTDRRAVERLGRSADQARGGQGRCAGDAKGPDRQRRQRRLRREGQYRDADRQCGGHARRQRVARRPDGRRSHDRRRACRIRAEQDRRAPARRRFVQSLNHAPATSAAPAAATSAEPEAACTTACGESTPGAPTRINSRRACSVS